MTDPGNDYNIAFEQADADVCPACGIPWINHVGVAGLCRQLAELRAIVDKLPKTKDGVAVVPGKTVYRYEKDDNAVVKFRVNGYAEWSEGDDGEPFIPWAIGNGGFGRSARDCYSTRAAAEAAKGTL